MNLLALYKKNPKISTDTRKIQEGSIFFALKGANFDGNKFASTAIGQGAAYVVVEDPSVVEDERYILVDDVLKSLQELSTAYRKTLSTKIIVVAGSNGKTTSKELLQAVLSKKLKTFSTPGNLNNHIGVPLTLLQMPEDTEIAVIEIGANHTLENAFLCEIAKPDFGLVTNCGKDHLEGFGGIEGVISSNKEVYDYLRETGGQTFINGDDTLLLSISEGVKRITYGADPSNDYSGTLKDLFPFVSVDYNGLTLDSHLFGSFHLYNILAATAVGAHFGVSLDDIREAVKEYTPVNNRSQIINWNNNKVLLDAYNANPSSMGEMISTFARFQHPLKVLVLGDMFELGKDEETEHAEMVDTALKSGAESSIFVGKAFAKHRSANGHFFENTEEAKRYIHEKGFKNAFFLVKGSRGMALERIFQ